MNETAIHFCCGGPNWVEIATLICLAFGGLFAWWQWRKAQKSAHIENMRQLLNEFKDKEVQKFFYKYLKNPATHIYDTPFKFETGVEEPLDRLLTLYSTVCYMRERGVIERREFTFFAYQIHKTLLNSQIARYLEDMAMKSRTAIRGSYPFIPLVREGVRMGGDLAYRRILNLQSFKKRGYDSETGGLVKQIFRDIQMWFGSKEVFHSWRA